jgi:hypothetical protein
MSWPSDTDYYDAIQNPKHAFADAALREGTPKQDGMGELWMDGGSFACVFQINSGKQNFAVRCFKTPVVDQAARYELITSHLRRIDSPAFCAIDYQPRGIKVRGEFYPVLKMEWAQGTPLDVYVREQLGNPQALRAVRQELISLLDTLKANGIAHGDLQHRNIMVSPEGRLRLVDYDGMYVPGIEARCGPISPEGGHPNFQHPRRRQTDYALGLDNFSSLILYLSIWAIEVQPKLWAHFNNADNLIFVRRDFEGPQSAVMDALRASPETDVARMTERLLAECRRSAALSVRELRAILADTGPSPGMAPGLPSTGIWVEDEPPATKDRTAPASPLLAETSIPPSQALLRVTDAGDRPVTTLKTRGTKKGRSISARIALRVHNDGKSARELRIGSSAEWLRPLGSPSIPIGAGEQREIEFEALLGETIRPQAAVSVRSPGWYEDDIAFVQTVPVEVEAPPRVKGIFVAAAIGILIAISVLAVFLMHDKPRVETQQSTSRPAQPTRNTSSSGSTDTPIVRPPAKPLEQPQPKPQVVPQVRPPLIPQVKPQPARPQPPRLLAQTWSFQYWHVEARTREGARSPEVCLVYSHPVSSGDGGPNSRRLVVALHPDWRYTPEISADGMYDGQIILSGHGQSYRFDPGQRALGVDSRALIELFSDGIQIMVSTDSVFASQTGDVYWLLGFTDAYNKAESLCWP